MLRLFIISISAVLMAGLLITCFAIVKPLYFREKIWTEWTCTEGENVGKVIFSPNSLEKEIHCTKPFPYVAQMNKYGLRKVLPEPTSLSETEILLFGDSYSWGTGLSEEESMAQQLSNFENHAKILTFARPGDSPAGMLFTMEKMVTNGQLKEMSKVKKIIFNFRDTHFSRSSGRGRWFFHNSPKYALQNKSVEFQGLFSELSNLDNYSFFKKGLMFLKFFLIARDGETPRVEDTDLLAGIFNKTQNIVSSEMNSHFYLNFWPENLSDGAKERRDTLISKLDSKIKILESKSVIESFKNNSHPSASGSRKMALFISQNTSQ